MDDLLGRQIDVLYSVDLSDGTTALKWCQGKVVEVIDDAKVTVEWDAAPILKDVKRVQLVCSHYFPASGTKITRQEHGAWRLDVDVELEDDMDESDDEDEVII
jgi:hypothetical protein